MEPIEDIDKCLREIEIKYTLSCDLSPPADDYEDQLHILAQEFDTLGLPQIDLKQCASKLLPSIVNNTFLLIQLHRKTLLEITDRNILHRSKETKIDELEKNILHLKLKRKMSEEQNLKIEGKILKLTSECKQLNKTITLHNRETDKMKQYFKSKQNELTHHIKSLENENHHLKEMFGRDIDKYFNKEDKLLTVLKNYKKNEQTNKDCLQKLEENNTEIMNEILNLRRELALAYLKEK